MRLHSPRVAAALRPVNTYLRYAAGFDPRLRELAILVTVREHDCQFAWAAHEDEARRAGLSAEVMDIIRQTGWMKLMLRSLTLAVSCSAPIGSHRRPIPVSRPCSSGACWWIWLI